MRAKLWPVCTPTNKAVRFQFMNHSSQNFCFYTIWQGGRGGGGYIANQFGYIAIVLAPTHLVSPFSPRKKSVRTSWRRAVQTLPGKPCHRPPQTYEYTELSLPPPPSPLPGSLHDLLTLLYCQDQPRKKSFHPTTTKTIVGCPSRLSDRCVTTPWWYSLHSYSYSYSHKPQSYQVNCNTRQRELKLSDATKTTSPPDSLSRHGMQHNYYTTT